MAGKSTNEMPDSKSQLTPKQERFVGEYLTDLNATQAAIRAGYSRKRASEYGYQLLKKTTVQKAVQKAQEQWSKRVQINQDRVLRELGAIRFSNIADFVSWDSKGVTLKDSTQLTPEQSICVSEVFETVTRDGSRTVRLKLHRKEKALELIGRHLGMFKDKLGIGTEDSVPPVRFVDAPPVPATIAEWQKQVAEAEEERQKRKEAKESKIHPNPF